MENEINTIANANININSTFGKMLFGKSTATFQQEFKKRKALRQIMGSETQTRLDEIINRHWSLFCH